MDQFLGQLQLVSFGFPPKGWALCNGQLMPVNQNQALFSLIGTTFGGDGRTTFALPDMRGRAAVSSNSSFPLGLVQGTETVTLLASNMPAHTHTLGVAPSPGTLGPPLNNSFAGVASVNTFAATPNGFMAPSAIAMAGGSQPHENRTPFTVMSWIIALTGIFPSRN